MASNMMENVRSFIETAEERAKDKEWGLARADYLQACEVLKQCIMDEPEAKDLVKKVEENLVVVNHELAKELYQKGIGAVENEEWETAIDLLEEATELAKITDVPFLEDIKLVLDKARIGDRDARVMVNAAPFISRGDNFKHNANYGEAVLEYQVAAEIVANLPENHKYIAHINKQLMECRRSIVRPYLKKAYRAGNAGRYVKAVTLLRRAFFLIDNGDDVYRDFIGELLKKAESHLSEKEIHETEEFESQEVWEKAVKDYEEALDLYSSYTITDPFAPAYAGVNRYEDKFAESRRRLGRLYKERADRLRNSGKIEKAIRNYKEAIKLLPKSDNLFHEAFAELKKLRVQVTLPENK